MTKKLPKGWVWAKLGEVCDARRGTSITKKETTPGKYPVIAGGRVPSYYHNQFNRTGETVTVSASGAYAGFVDYHDQPIFASDCSTFQADKNGRALIRFLFLFLKSRQDKIYKMQLGAAQPHVYCRDIVKIDIPLPPIAEQKRIADLLNRQMALAEKARAAAEAQLEDIRVLPAALLREAFSGTPPISWKSGIIGEVCEFAFGDRITKKTHSGSKYPVYGGGGESFRTNSYNRENEYVLSRFAMSAKCVRFVSGKFWLIDSGGTFSISENFAKAATKEFVGYFLLRSQSDIFALARGQGQQNLDMAKFKDLPIPLPPVAEQQKIVARLNRQMAAADKIRAAAEAQLEDIRALPAALLRRSFSFSD